MARAITKGFLVGMPQLLAFLSFVFWGLFSCSRETCTTGVIWPQDDSSSYCPHWGWVTQSYIMIQVLVVTWSEVLYSTFIQAPGCSKGCVFPQYSKLSTSFPNTNHLEDNQSQFQSPLRKRNGTILLWSKISTGLTLCSPSIFQRRFRN